MEQAGRELMSCFTWSNSYWLWLLETLEVYLNISFLGLNAAPMGQPLGRSHWSSSNMCIVVSPGYATPFCCIIMSSSKDCVLLMTHLWSLMSTFFFSYCIQIPMWITTNHSSIHIFISQCRQRLRSLPQKLWLILGKTTNWFETNVKCAVPPPNNIKCYISPFSASLSPRYNTRIFHHILAPICDALCTHDCVGSSPGV